MISRQTFYNLKQQTIFVLMNWNLIKHHVFMLNLAKHFILHLKSNKKGPKKCTEGYVCKFDSTFFAKCVAFTEVYGKKSK